MKKFVLVGDIEFIDGTAYVRRVAYGAYVSEEELRVLDSIGYYDYVMPHYYKGRIVFDQYHDEDWHTNRELLIEKLDREALEEKIQARRDADY
jgi:hypothetical protein